MKNQNFPLFAAIIFVLTLTTSCQAIGDIFKAGMGFGIFLVVLVIGLILYFVMRGRNR